MLQIQEAHFTKTEGWLPTSPWVLCFCLSTSHTRLIPSARADANLFQVRKLRLEVCAPSMVCWMSKPLWGRSLDGEKPGSPRDGRHSAHTISPELLCHLLSQEVVPP